MNETNATRGNPWLLISPKSLIGRLVQISLDTYELAGPHLYIPPLLINDCLSGVHKRTGFSKVSFMGIPQGNFDGVPDADSDWGKIRTITFYNSEPDFQPQFLANPDFISYLNQHHFYVPVRVYCGSNQRQSFGDGEEADSEVFSYVGWGIVQLFRPGKGFEQRWRDKDPWLKRLRESEADLLERHPQATP
jgi:hypothetical protein